MSSTSSSKDRDPGFLEQVQEAVDAHRMIAAGDLLIVAISGGPDSTALLHALVQLRSKLRFRLRAAHVNHGIRGAEAEADAKAAAAFARKLNVPFHQHRADVPGDAESRGLSLEHCCFRRGKGTGKLEGLGILRTWGIHRHNRSRREFFCGRTELSGQAAEPDTDRRQFLCRRRCIGSIRPAAFLLE